MHGIKKKLGNAKRSIQRSWRPYLRRKSRKLRRILSGKKPETGYVFAIVCVKKTEYVDMAIDNVNSLDFINSGHHFVIYADTACYKAFMKLRHKLDYPLQTACIDMFGSTGKPWQYCKLEALIDASRKGYILTDADEIWHHDPVIDPEQITMLTLSNLIKDNPVENSIALHLFADRGAVGFKHYCTGFMYVPARYMTDALADDMRKCTELIFTDPLDFIEYEKRPSIRRLAEELGVNMALQKHCTRPISILKAIDGPKDKNTLQSLYYGCKNQINE